MKASILACLLILPAGLGFAAPPESIVPGKLTWGTSPTFAPFEFQRNGQAVGFDVDMMAELGKRVGLQSAMLGMDFAGLVPAVQSRRIDAVVSGMYITAARAEVIDFVPYLKIGDQMVVPKGNTGKLATGPNAACGHRLVVVVNTQYEKSAQALNDACKAAGRPAIELLSVATTAVATLSLAQGRAEGGITSTPVVAAMMENSPNTFEPLGEPFNTGTRLGIGVSKENTGLRDALSSALKQIKSEGLYDELLKKWNLPGTSSIFSE